MATMIAASSAPDPGPRTATILLRSGALIDLLDPDYTKVSLYDIAHGLAGEIRYNAQSPKRESVAQHSRVMAEWARTRRGAPTEPAPRTGVEDLSLGRLAGGPGSMYALGPRWHPAIAPLIAEYGVPRWSTVALGCLFHDAPEGLLGDIVSPLKRLPQMRWFCDLEEVHMARIIERFALPDPHSPVWKFVEAIDHAVVTDEKRSLWPPGGVDAKSADQGLGVAIEPVGWDTAALEWLVEHDTIRRAIAAGE